MAEQGKFFLREKKIMIYGAGSLGKHCSGVLKATGIEVEAYIDKRADTFKEYEGRKIFHIEDVKNFNHKEEYCIIVAIRNVFEHSQLVLQFYDMGFRFLYTSRLRFCKAGQMKSMKASARHMIA